MGIEQHADFVRVPAGAGSFLGADVFVEMYVFGEDDAIAQLMCISAMPPGDRWLSLARAFQFLAMEPVQRDAGLPPPERTLPTPLEP